MCGIVFTNSDLKSQNYKKIVEYTKYRGPDLQNSFKYKQLFFGFNYLSITGTLKGSPQPFIKDKCVLIFNGEIFNYKILKKELMKKGVSFETNSDTEVLLECLKLYGIEKTHQLIEGMWSFVFYDSKKNKLFISRDRVGIKPLFYSKNSKNFFFSSSVETIKKFFTENEKKINLKILKKYIYHGTLFDSKQTIYKNINIFPPGNYCEIKGKSFKFKKYWHLKFEEKKDIKNFKTFKTIFFNKIENHFNYNVKTALPLSSGLDSNFLLSKYKFKKNLICYSLKNFENDHESKIIKKNIRKLKQINHKFIDCKKLNNKTEIDKIIKNLEYPIRSFQPIYQYLIREQAKKDNVRIILNGDGADEVFGGYSYGVPYRLSTIIRNGKKKEAIRLAKDMQIFFGKNYSDLYQEGIKLSKKQNTLKNFLVKRILNTHIPYWLYIDDFISMKHSIENRVPFLDSKIISEVFKFKEEYFYKNKTNKFLLRKLFKKNPDNLSNKKYHKPGNYSLVYKTLSKSIQDILENRKIKLIDCDKLKKEYTKDKSIHNVKTADKWFRIYLLNRMMNYKKFNV